MSPLTRRIYRERRRLSLLMLFAAMAGFLLFQGDARQVLGIPMPIVASLILALGLGLVALLTAIAMPIYRFAFEIVALALLIYAAMAQHFPVLSLEAARVPLVNMFLIFVSILGLYHLIYGGFTDRFLRLHTYVDRAVGVTTLPRGALWRALLPDPSSVGVYHDATLERMSPVPGNPDALRMLHRFPGGLFMERVLEFDQIKDGWSFRYSYRVIGDEENRADLPRTHTLVLEPREGQTAVHVRWERPDYPMRKALCHWIDDWPGRQLDQMLRHAEARDPVLPLAPFPA